MRIFNNQQTAEQQAKSIPFTGLGFATTSVQAVASAMTATYYRAGSEWVWVPTQDNVFQPSGYSLLVALSREIRGR